MRSRRLCDGLARRWAPTRWWKSVAGRSFVQRRRTAIPSGLSLSLSLPEESARESSVAAPNLWDLHRMWAAGRQPGGALIRASTSLKGACTAETGGDGTQGFGAGYRGEGANPRKMMEGCAWRGLMKHGLAGRIGGCRGWKRGLNFRGEQGSLVLTPSWLGLGWSSQRRKIEDAERSSRLGVLFVEMRQWKTPAALLTCLQVRCVFYLLACRLGIPGCARDSTDLHLQRVGSQNLEKLSAARKKKKGSQLQDSMQALGGLTCFQ